VTLAVDSEATVRARRTAVCGRSSSTSTSGCPVRLRAGDAGRVADLARAAGLEVRGVMGYEGHLMLETGEDQARQTEECMVKLLAAHATSAATW
jgi:D-serine deaminase-like pyridoxal phosphate-dependent protein